MLNAEQTVCAIIDVQGKLAQLMADKEDLFANLKRLIQGAKVLDIPTVLTEQNPDGLGPTIAELAPLLSEVTPLPKFSFSCWGEPAFQEALAGLNRRQVLIGGIETHICIYQTTLDLIREGYEVHIVTDAVSSRARSNRELALEKMKDAGARLTSVEMALFELLKTAEGPRFKEILKIVR